MQRKKDRSPAIILLLTAACVLFFGLFVVERGKKISSTSHRTQNTGSTNNQQYFEWKMALSWPKNFPGIGIAGDRLAETVEKASNGRLVIKVYGAGELVPALGVFDAVSNGGVQMGYATAYYWKGQIPEAPFFTAIPFGMTTTEVDAWLHSGGGLELWQEIYSEYNVIPFPAGNTGTQMGGWFNKEIRNLADLRSIKMRIAGLGAEVLNRIGTETVTIPGGEVFVALKTGVIDATEWIGPFNDLAFGFHKAAKYYYYPGWHEPSGTFEVSINRQAYEALPPDLQEILKQAISHIGKEVSDVYTASNNLALDTLVNKHKVIVKRFPDEVLDALRRESHALLKEMAAKDKQMAKVYKSYMDYQSLSLEYNKISEQAYQNVR